MIISKYVLDFSCSRNSTLCITDENEILLWGQNILEPESSQIYDEPIVIVKVEGQSLNIEKSDNQVLDKIFAIKNTGVIITSRQSNSIVI